LEESYLISVMRQNKDNEVKGVYQSILT